MHKYCDIAVALPVDRTFQYRIPDNLIADAAIGKRAFVPFQNRSIVGYIVGFSDDREIKDVKEMISIIDGVPMLTDEMLKLTRWIADNYFCSWG